MKTQRLIFSYLILVLFALCGLAGCEAYPIDGTAVALDHGSCVSAQVERFGDAVCLLQVPAGMGCRTAILLVDGTPAPQADYRRACCGAGDLLAVDGDSCARLTDGAVATAIDCGL